MLAELRVSHLGVIEDVTVVLGAGMTALTGETGAGKTLIVDAIELLLGAPADPSLVRPGSDEAVVEGRFCGAGGDETILTRVVPASGRSRAYIDGRMASAAQLAELGGALVDMHGQHAQQSLLSARAQRVLLDAFAGISSEEVSEARREMKRIEDAQAALGGDERTRAREMDLLRFQLEELDAAGLESADEDATLRDEEERLADAASLREAAWAVCEGLSGDESLSDRLGGLVAALAGKRPLREIHDRLLSTATELSDIAHEARNAAETIEDDPERLAQIGARRQLLSDLRRKYGETLADVIAFRDSARERLGELESHEQRSAELGSALRDARRRMEEAERRLLDARRAAAPELSSAVQERLRELAMPRATFSVEVDDEAPGDRVVWMLGANPGEPVLPLAKVASGGELARTMLAARLVVGRLGAGEDAGPGTLVFDEVDAGIGGEAAVSVGRALSAVGGDHQVVVVTHLPQVAAFADRHLVVEKRTVGERTVAEVGVVDGHDRVVEVSRMLSGSPGSETARRHAEELLALGASAEGAGVTGRRDSRRGRASKRGGTGGGGGDRTEPTGV